MHIVVYALMFLGTLESVKDSHKPQGTVDTFFMQLQYLLDIQEISGIGGLMTAMLLNPDALPFPVGSCHVEEDNMCE